MVVNPSDDDGDDLDDYKDDAKDAKNNVTPSGGVAGGVVMQNMNGASASGSSATGSASSAGATGSSTSTASAASSTSTSDAGAIPARAGAVVGVILAAGMGAWALL